MSDIIKKTIAWRVIATFLGFMIIYILTGELNVSLKFFLINFVVLSIAYYIFEQVWKRRGSRKKI